MITIWEQKPRAAEARGFTLTEMLVVIGVIGILSALLLPAISTAKGYSRSASCKNHLHQMGIDLKMYVDEHRSTFPFYLGPAGPSYGDEAGQGGRAAGLVYWSSKLYPYYPLNWTNSQFHCPGYMGTNSGAFNYKSIDRLGSYAYNIWGSAGTDKKFVDKDFGVGPVLFWKRPPVSEGQIKAPSEMLSVGESRFLTGHEITIGNITFGAFPGGMDTLSCGIRENDPPFDPARHGKNYNQLLCDGHVSSLSPSVLFNPTNSAAMWNYDHEAHPELW